MKRVWIILSSLLLMMGVASAETVTTLQPVVVTANRTELPVDRVPASIEVITAAQIEQMPATELKNVLTDAVGLTVVDYGTPGGLATLSIRGSEAGQVLVLLDGVRLNSGQNGQFNLANLPIALDQIERIEILRGTASALYGPNALAGVVQIVTKRADRSQVRHLSTTVSRDDAVSGAASVSGYTGPVDYRLGFGAQTGNGYRTNSEVEAFKFDGQVGMALSDKHRFELQTFALTKNNGAPGPVSFPSAVDRELNDNLIFTGRWISQLDASTLRLHGSYDRQLNRFEDADSFLGATTSRHELQTGTLDVQWEKGADDWQLVVGSDLFYEDLDSSENGQHHQWRGSVFGLYQLSLLEAFEAYVALRLDEHSAFDAEVSPRAGLSYRWPTGTRLHLSAGKAYRAPTFNDRFWPAGAFTAGNPDLSPEVAWEYEAGIDHAFGDAARVGVTVFQRDVKRLIEWQEVRPFFYTPENVGRARIQGLEATGRWRFGKAAHLGANYTYLMPRDLDDGAVLANRARHEMAAHIDLRVVENLYLRLGGRYYALYRDRGNTIFMTDMALRYHVKLNSSTEGRLELGAKNLFDRDEEFRTGFPMAPFTPYLNLSFRF